MPHTQIQDEDELTNIVRGLTESKAYNVPKAKNGFNYHLPDENVEQIVKFILQDRERAVQAERLTWLKALAQKGYLNDKGTSQLTTNKEGK